MTTFIRSMLACTLLGFIIGITGCEKKEETPAPAPAPAAPAPAAPAPAN